MRKVFEIFLLFIIIPVCHNSMAQKDNAILPDPSNQDSLRLIREKEQWESVSDLTPYLKSAGMKKVGDNIDTLNALLGKKPPIKWKIIYKTIPIYVSSSSKIVSDTLHSFFIDSITPRKRGFLKRILQR